ncbi:MAG: hypothetical protein ACK56I_35260, partial [bacterium]
MPASESHEHQGGGGGQQRLQQRGQQGPSSAHRCFQRRLGAAQGLDTSRQMPDATRQVLAQVAGHEQAHGGLPTGL